MRRVLTVLACAALVLTGCGTPHDPEVTFYAAGKTIRVTPSYYCDLRGGNCVQKQAASMKVPAGKPVQISVPGQLADGRWEVVYSYLDPVSPTKSDLVGKQSETLLGRGKDYTYTVTVPRPVNQLVRIEVHEAAAAVLADGSLATRGVWIVDIEP
ncbi:hypothetical protein Lesp02_65120 [Lentzea sp. NBRC 105346]|uniref:DUF2771 family protein n=1 Tax=Lentzea sp. NBRC 105346 TaxID=3032205 RepID=UPI0024A5A017|nr:DUF2771 family protein [Lentzea sp. NBRC 105346]GLZ34325.1 hypothetical protein Lesp02_65120 [Lentzea sp. NBRC 105346]